MTPAQRILGRVDKSHDSLMPLIIRELLTLVEKQREALERQLSSTSHYRSSAKNPNPEIDEARFLSEQAIALTDETMERLGKV